jgi:hypothetical protein
VIVSEKKIIKDMIVEKRGEGLARDAAGLIKILETELALNEAVGLNLILHFLACSNTRLRWAVCSASSLDLTVMSSMYTSSMSPISAWNTLFIIRWYVAHAFFNPKGITL